MKGLQPEMRKSKFQKNEVKSDLGSVKLEVRMCQKIIESKNT
jgi:hypothetical protein